MDPLLGGVGVGFLLGFRMFQSHTGRRSGIVLGRGTAVSGIITQPVKPRYGAKWLILSESPFQTFKCFIN